MVLEYKLVAANDQQREMDQAIRTAQLVHNHCLRLWIESPHTEKRVGKHDIPKHTTKPRSELEWCKKLDSTAMPTTGEQAWTELTRFYDHHKKGVKPVDDPRFKKNTLSVEYKQSGWLEYFAKIMGRMAMPVSPAYTAQMCSGCDQTVKKDLKTRRHVCGCSVKLDRGHNATINIPKSGLRMAGHAKTRKENSETLVETEEDQPKLASVDEARIPRLWQRGVST